jgi:hypothetical protein
MQILMMDCLCQFMHKATLLLVEVVLKLVKLVFQVVFMLQ